MGAGWAINGTAMGTSTTRRSKDVSIPTGYVAVAITGARERADATSIHRLSKSRQSTEKHCWQWITANWFVSCT